jgi:hypothetical protein
MIEFMVFQKRDCKLSVWLRKSGLEGGGRKDGYVDTCRGNAIDGPGR